jgi:5,10-methylenetetrahydromethanopterin reductase
LVDFGIAFQGNGTPVAYRALAEAVDGYAFDVVSVYNDLLFQPALGPLLWMAPLLHRARIGPAALNPYTLHPLEIAGQVALLDLATDGRAYLGLARGAWLDRIGVAQPRPVQTLREAALLVRHLLGGCTQAFDGEIFCHPPNALLQSALPRHMPSITIGTWGAATARMAGEVADEIKIGGSANPLMVSVLRPHVLTGALRAARREDTVGICVGAVTVVDSDREVARAIARRAVAAYLPVVAPLDPTIDPDLRARGPEAVAHALLDRFAFAGRPEDIVRQVEDIFAAGATRVEFGTPHGTDALEAIRLLGEQVLPAFR